MRAEGYSLHSLAVVEFKSELPTLEFSENHKPHEYVWLKSFAAPQLEYLEWYLEEM